MSSNTLVFKEQILNFHKILNQLRHQDTSGLLTTEQIEKFNQVKSFATSVNPWFTLANIDKALEGLAQMVRPEAVDRWLSNYDFNHANPKRVGLIMAGNIPMVGFHDLIAVWASGHHPVVKLSSQDRLLLQALVELFNEVSTSHPLDVTWLTDRKLDDIDAVIATGSNNSSRYFEYYFGKYPNIIRKNRNSVAVLTGNEDGKELVKLGEDIFSYFGLGCRNVSKLFIHDDFNLDNFFNAIYEYSPVVNHNKYANNYDYYKALWLMNREDLLDNGFLLLRESEAMTSPVGTLFYERFNDEAEVEKRLEMQRDQIQCIVSSKNIPFGHSQQPELWDYADGIDTLEFLTQLK
jgi:hypothetical protein